MLSSRLLPRDKPWLRELAHEAAAAGGRPTQESDNVDDPLVDLDRCLDRDEGAPL